MGSVEAPALVVLGDVAAGSMHVRFDGVGTLSLRGGYFWGDGDGDAGICDWEVADGEERPRIPSSR
jgi:hypothetical protein